MTLAIWWSTSWRNQVAQHLPMNISNFRHDRWTKMLTAERRWEVYTFCFSLFILSVVLVCLSMFLSIIGEHFRRVRGNVERSDSEIFGFMWRRFQRWIDEWWRGCLGWRNVSEEVQIREQYHHPMDVFVKRADQLLNALNRVGEHRCLAHLIWLSPRCLDLHDTMRSMSDIYGTRTPRNTKNQKHAI